MREKQNKKKKKKKEDIWRHFFSTFIFFHHKNQTLGSMAPSSSTTREQRRDDVEQFVHEFLRSKSVDEEVLEYVKDLLLDLIFEEEEEENETPDVESISENVGDMLEAFATEEEVRDMCANALVRAKMSGRAEEDARRSKGEKNGETETKKQKTF